MTPPLSNFPKNSSILVWPSVPMRLTCYYEWMAKRNESTSELLWRGCYYHFCYHHWDSFYLYHNCHCHWYFYLYHSLSCYHCYLVVVPQSSTAAPVEEAAQALRVKRQDGGDILNGCDPNTAIGGFLLFPLFRSAFVFSYFPHDFPQSQIFSLFLLRAISPWFSKIPNISNSHSIS